MEVTNSRRGFDGLRVLTLESRRAPEMGKLSYKLLNGDEEE
jgi:hypothetical protein